MDAIDKFIAKSHDLATPTNDRLTPQVSHEDDWNQLAAGVDLGDYDPKPLPPIPPLPPPPPPPKDTGRIPNSFLISTKKDVEDFFAEPGVCGLLNLGNTCYMNAGLQCVCSVEQIALFYLSELVPQPVKLNCRIEHDNTDKEDVVKNDMKTGEIEEGDCMNGDKMEQPEKMDEGETVTVSGGEKCVKSEYNNEGKDEVCKEKTNDSTTNEKNGIDPLLVSKGQISARFSSLVRKLWVGQFSAIVPKNFKMVLGFLYSQFNGYRQQDCQEFLAILLDSLHEDIRHTRNEEGYSNHDNMNSIITDIFQGQLKSEVTCCRCGHVSTKNDPFMYLSVPLPHANERQIEIIWSPVTRPSQNRKLTKFLLVIPKLSNVAQIKSSLCDMIGDGIIPDHVTLAHVKNSTVDLTLADTLSIKHVKDKEFQLYAFETLTTAPSNTETNNGDSNSPSSLGYTRLPDTDSNSPMELDSVPSTEAQNDPWNGSSDGLPAKVLRYDDSPDETMENTDTVTPDDSEATPLIDPYEATSINKDSNETTPRKVVIMEWHSCAICLEEMVDSELLTHTPCGALLCATCLESSQQHIATESGHMPCPVCQQVVLPSEAFVPLATPEDPSSIIKLLQITILFRYEDEPGILSLLGHPALLNLPSNESVDYYYSAVSSLVPAHLTTKPWSLALTDRKGRYCSRCLFSSQCRGCVLTNAMKEVSLKPGDHLCVSFHRLSHDFVQEASGVEVHSSLDTYWSSIVSLQDCLELFAQKEILGSDNPWWCPQCEQNQEAIRHLTISHLPNTVIIHLKRFLFHDNVASKVDMGVTFPLSLTSSSSFPHVINGEISNELILTGCVCHFGTLNGGHYTAYSRHPVSGKWHYFNDETVIETIPSDKDSESAYILFYTQQRKGSQIDLPVERGEVTVNEEEELQQMEPLLRLMKPKLKPLPPPLPSLPPLKRSSSTGKLTDNFESNEYQLQHQLAASLGIDLPAVFSSNVTIKRSSSNPHLTDQSANGQLLQELNSQKLKSFDI